MDIQVCKQRCKYLNVMMNICITVKHGQQNGYFFPVDLLYPITKISPVIAVQK